MKGAGLTGDALDNVTVWLVLFLALRVVLRVVELIA